MLSPGEMSTFNKQYNIEYLKFGMTARSDAVFFTSLMHIHDSNEVTAYA